MRVNLRRCAERRRPRNPARSGRGVGAGRCSRRRWGRLAPARAHVTELTPTWRLQIRSGATSFAHRWFAICATVACSARPVTETPTTRASRDAAGGSIGRERDPNYPPTVYVREEALLDGILRFFGDRIFRPTRQRQGPMGQIREKSQKDSPCLDRRSSGFSRGTGRPIPTKTGRGLSFSLSSAARTAPDDALPLLQDLSADDELVYQPHREQVDRAPTQRAAVSGTQRVGCRFLESKEAPAELLCPMQAMAIPLWALTSCGRRISLVEGERDHDADLGDLI